MCIQNLAGAPVPEQASINLASINLVPRGNLRSQASRLALRSAIGIAAAAGASLLAPGQARADCVVGVTIQCDDTFTTDTTYSANPPNDRNYVILTNTPVIVDVNAGTTVSGNGLAVTNTGDGGVSIINNGVIRVDPDMTPTSGGTAALSISAAGGTISYTGGDIVNYGDGNAFDAAQTGGAGSVDINISGNVFSATGEGITIRDVATSTGISIFSGSVTALTADGIDVQSQSATGNVTVMTNGDIKAGNIGIVGVILNALATGNVDVTADASIDAASGVAADNLGSGSTTVTTIGPVTATTGNGIFAQSNGGAVTVAATDVTSTGNTAIVARQTNSITDAIVTVIAGNVSGTTGIDVVNSGIGATSVAANGTVTATSAVGIKVTANDAVNVSVANTVTGATAGLTLIGGGFFGGDISVTGTGGFVGGTGSAATILNNSTGTVTVDISGASSSTGGEGIVVRDTSAGGKISVATGAVTALTAGKDGIDVQSHSLIGNITEVANGDIKAGNAGMVAVILNAVAVGNIDVTANGSLDAQSGMGIDAENYGSGSTKVTTVGPVTVTTGNGIFARSAGGDVTVNAGDVTSTGNTAIVARQTGAGAIDITTSGTVEGASAAIDAQSNAGHAIGITLSGATHNSSQTAAALAINTAGGATTLINDGALLGRVTLGDFVDKVTNNATWTTGGTSLFGGGIDTVVNAAGATLVTASDGASLETTTFSGLESLSNSGRLTIQDGGAGDVTVVSGNATLAPGSTYAIDIGAALQSDLLHVTGAATITGSTLNVAVQGAAIGHYTVLTADSGLNGEFAGVTGITSTAFLSVTDSYDINNAYLDVLQVHNFASVGLTPNQIATGEALDSIPASGSLYNAVLGLATDAEAEAAFDQLSGEIHSSAKGMLVQDSHFVRDAATNRIASAFGDGGTTAALPVMAYGEGGPEMVAADTDRFAVWGQAFGSWGKADSDGNAAAFDRSTGGLLAGADTLVGDWRVGVLGGYSHASFDADDRNSSGDSNSYHLGLYGGTNWGAIALRTGAAYSWSSLSTKRSVAFNGFADQLSADYDAGTAQMFGELAYKADAGRFKFEPFANLAYVSVHTDGFTETGGGAALTSTGSTTDATFTTLGLRGATDFALGGMNATARGTLGWRHAFGDVAPTSTFAFAGGDAFTIAGVPIARDAALVEAGLDVHLAPNATLGLTYSGQFGGGVDQGAKVDLGVRF
ncbi:autotransporter outer membrane beta-barrel domain-containing protein [Mesorhizobium sp. M00.F.Ca.ET.186.01.1.1]|nr:autotransporter outer membrane beta-barrel domain-containing protein [bacterium M00.F.Ca.ET.205.01.1.1]TGU50434.1 autotransporter outer membrane beta-barrel domain-containing protein [bacterium M00.F.Ca.ET.152.01.1.1]TGV33907.1 autotransporter outer membrane beta-barrel domain-containing protein [Mesorhizobium sp. M00.F.Ca.ET.186.01.1.1]TGZ40798.1 autotransporter outer membrane beta-barrel domain-containing protein [bacterium M00.F.Ca.ET.162.01.1.1]